MIGRVLPEVCVEPLVVVGGSGFVGTAICAAAIANGRPVTIIDRETPRFVDDRICWQPADVLIDDVSLPEGTVVLATGGHPRPRWPWTMALDTAVCTARLLPRLQGRHVILLSSVEAYGWRAAPLTEDDEPCLPWPAAALEAWCRDVIALARDACPPSRAAPLCRRLADADGSGRWTYGLAKRAQELMFAAAGTAAHLTVLRVANTFGVGQEGVVSRLVRRAVAEQPLRVCDSTGSFVPVEALAGLVIENVPDGLYNVGDDPIAMPVLASLILEICGSSSRVVVSGRGSTDSWGVVDVSRVRALGFELPPLEESLRAFVQRLRSQRPPLFSRALPVVLPPRPLLPDQVAERQQQCLWNGALKNGNRWSAELTVRLAETLQLPDTHELLVTVSGTEALRLAIVAAASRPRAEAVAIVPSFTYPTTIEVLKQLGYSPRYVDVDPDSWTIDVDAVAQALAERRASLVVCVDTFGNPCDYARLSRICSDADVPLVADSAASIGSLYQGKPVAAQADAHAFSMSFAKALSAGGSGGAVAVPRGRLGNLADWTRSALMAELHAIPALDQLAILPALVERRAVIASIYADAVRDEPGFTAQAVRPLDRHSYCQWVMRVTSREWRASLERGLAVLGVQTKRYFQAQHVARGCRAAGLLPATEELHDGVLALPMSSELTVEDAEDVVAALVECSYGRAGSPLASRRSGIGSARGGHG
jgi:dTDP-4-amino-4,6-dideoxygalactose transaminase/nucleoside-diphosphate-sugar epimerase